MINYVEIRIFSTYKEEFVPDKRIGNLITLIHRAAKGKTFALGFPEYRQGEHRKLGSALRLYSFEGLDALKSILIDKRLSLFLLDHCATQPIQQLSEFQIKGWVRYCKSTITKKIGASHKRRAENRLQAGKRRTPFIEKNAREAVNNLPYFFHYSLSSAMELPIFIKKESSDGVGEFKFDSFGLSLAGGKGVPILGGEK
jgi:CRISPR-associated endoribonuclease Cas6/Csy4 subtype I-F